jgi:hypothetical protein
MLTIPDSGVHREVEEDGEANNQRSASAQPEDRRKRLCGIWDEWPWNSLELRRKENIRNKMGGGAS